MTGRCTPTPLEPRLLLSSALSAVPASAANEAAATSSTISRADLTYRQDRYIAFVHLLGRGEIGPARARPSRVLAHEVEEVPTLGEPLSGIGHAGESLGECRQRFRGGHEPLEGAVFCHLPGARDPAHVPSASPISGKVGKTRAVLFLHVIEVLIDGTVDDLDVQEASPAAGVCVEP